MKAIRVTQFFRPEVVKLEDMADLMPGKGQVGENPRAVRERGTRHVDDELIELDVSLVLAFL
jgi:hypothetical protein